MAKHMADINIGKRAAEEAIRKYPRLTEKKITQILGIDRKSLWQWKNGTAPGGYALQCLCHAGCDIMYILTGRRRWNTMFQVIHKETGKIRTVYGFSGIKFLLWNPEDGCWEYGDMEKYKPMGAVA